MEANQSEMNEPSIDSDKLSYEIFSMLESRFLFGYDDQKLCIPKQIAPSPPPEAAIKNQRGKICVLSIDGGGMRGLIPGKALAYLELVLKTKSGNPEARIADYFDVAAGTGVGGIFPLCCSPPRTDAVRFSKRTTHGSLSPRMGNQFTVRQREIEIHVGFCGSSKSGLEQMMKEAFMSGARVLTLKDTLKPVLIPCFDLSSSAPFLFSRANALETDSFDFRLPDGCHATSADPGLFEPVTMVSIDGQTRCVGVDGGLAMSNPMAAAITHVLHNKQEFPFVRGVEDILVLSLGTTGQGVEASCEHRLVKKWKAKDWARPMARISTDSSADVVDQSGAMAFGQSRSSNYVRIQANSSNLGRCVADADRNPSPKNVKNLTEMAEEMLKQKNVESVMFGGKRIGEESDYEKLDWFAGELVSEHQRSCRIAPTVAFKQVYPNPS